MTASILANVHGRRGSSYGISDLLPTPHELSGRRAQTPEDMLAVFQGIADVQKAQA